MSYECRNDNVNYYIIKLKKHCVKASNTMMLCVWIYGGDHIISCETLSVRPNCKLITAGFLKVESPSSRKAEDGFNNDAARLFDN